MTYMKGVPLWVPLPARRFLKAMGATGTSLRPPDHWRRRTHTLSHLIQDKLTSTAIDRVKGAGQAGSRALSFPCMHGVSDSGEPSGISRLPYRPFRLPLNLTASALPTIAFEAQYPACMSPCQRFRLHLAVHPA